MKLNFLTSFIIANLKHDTTKNNIISTSPGGKKGLYYLGSLNYIKNNYDLSDFSFLGCSAGAWCSLYMCFTGNDNDFIQDILQFDFTEQSLYQSQLIYKNNLLKKYCTDDFNLDRLNIGVSRLGNINKLSLKTTVCNQFIDLEDAIDCCISSSHVPIITGGGIIRRYKNRITFDGGLTHRSKKYLKKNILHISSSTWKNKKYINMQGLSKIKELDSRAFFEDGYEDAKNNKEYLDSLLKCKHNNNDKKNSKI